MLSIAEDFLHGMCRHCVDDGRDQSDTLACAKLGFLNPLISKSLTDEERLTQERKIYFCTPGDFVEVRFFQLAFA